MDRRRFLTTGLALGVGAAALPWQSVAHADNAGVRVDFSAVSGRIVSDKIYGYSTGNLLSKSCLLAGDDAVRMSANKLRPPLTRFNAVQTGALLQAVFAGGLDSVA